MKYWLVALRLGMAFLLCGCSVDQPELGTVDDSEKDVQSEFSQTPEAAVADVISVDVSGNPNEYQFSVEIASADKGCDQYADWWEILTEDGQLVYRRILGHSHVSEQPFLRSGGPVNIGVNTVVIVRAHMHPDGYGGMVMMGTVQSGFEEVALMPDFADNVESEPPQPTKCAF